MCASRNRGPKRRVPGRYVNSLPNYGSIPEARPIPNPAVITLSEPLPIVVPVSKSLGDIVSTTTLANPLETHSYDGLLLDRIKKHPIISKPRNRVFVEIMYDDFSKKVDSKFFNVLKRSFFDNDGKNYDPSNQVTADNIMCCIYEKYCKSNDDAKLDIIKNLKIQLDEMESGDCPQGRCTRLLQVLFPLLD